MATLPIANKKDEQIGIIAAVVFVFLILLVLFVMTYEIADPPPQPYQVPSTMSLENIEIKNLSVQVGGGSQGTPSNDPVSPPKPQTQEILTKKENPDTKVNTGKGASNTAPNSQNEATSSKPSPDPFGSGGSSTEGTGAGAFGKDVAGVSGTGTGGISDGKGRIRQNDPNVNDIESDDNHIIHLQVIVNSEGYVVDCKNIAAKTTTNDQRIINRVIAAVKSQVRYNKKPGSSLEVCYETIRLNAH
ncbi:MAG: hypothetical protein N4A41_10630 [Crocinitomicaceae bacterium]|jgi:hypothetical protein|nr:hypothetical protein [Crocinitomicaceae bacterium]